MEKEASPRFSGSKMPSTPLPLGLRASRLLGAMREAPPSRPGAVSEDQRGGLGAAFFLLCFPKKAQKTVCPVLRPPVSEMEAQNLIFVTIIVLSLL